jgi:DNA-binding XRE family transcriptional regulator
VAVILVANSIIPRGDKKISEDATKLIYRIKMEDKSMSLKAARAVYAARRAQHLTQKELGEKIGVNSQIISNVESGYIPKVPRAKRIAAALGLDWTIFYADIPDTYTDDDFEGKGKTERKINRT